MKQKRLLARLILLLYLSVLGLVALIGAYYFKRLVP